MQLHVVVADHEDDLVAGLDEFLECPDENLMIAEDHFHLETGLGFFGMQAPAAFEPADVVGRLVGHGHDRIEIKDVAIQDEFDRVFDEVADVFKKPPEALVHEKVPALVSFPKAVLRVGRLGIRKMNVA